MTAIGISADIVQIIDDFVLVLVDGDNKIEMWVKVRVLAGDG